MKRFQTRLLLRSARRHRLEPHNSHWKKIESDKGITKTVLAPPIPGTSVLE